MSEKLGIAIKATEDAGAPKASSQPEASVEQTTEEPETRESKIVTTNEEIEGFYIVKSIAREVLSSDRITYRDSQSYFAVFADDNNRRPICRLKFNSATHKRISFIDENRQETSFDIETLDDIFNYRDNILEAAKKYV
jgi:hypothetical protein